uniref:Uncharacterized protein n=1 Tax=Solanum tuberosum TaxID=4113 RepID=M0ZYB6_SOLTU
MSFNHSAYKPWYLGGKGRGAVPLSTEFQIVHQLALGDVLVIIYQRKECFPGCTWSIVCAPLNMPGVIRSSALEELDFLSF